ncbi:MAG TPA: CBS domain-containing protein [Thermodesulfobacteriota bacterium]|nr:CBS domain-containing protein [Thermodesulfobacteriota bacterium]
MITDDIFLSELLNHPVLDQRGNEIGRVKDLRVVPGEAYPLVEGLYVKGRRGLFYILLMDVAVLNRKVIAFRGSEESLVSAEPQPHEILIAGHIMDKQVVDINGAKVVRVNDVRLGRVNKDFGLLAIDVGLGGLARRLGFRKSKKGTPIPWQYLKPLEPGLDHLTLTITRKNLIQMHPVDLAEIISEVSMQERSSLIDAVGKEKAGEALYELDEETRANIFKQMEPGVAADVLEVMEPDEAADVLGDLPESQAKEILNLMEEKEACDVQELLEHDEDSAGGLMTTDYVSFPREATVAEAMQSLRLLAPDVEMIYYLYILDKDDRLEGVLSLKDLILASPEMPLGEVMKTNPKKVHSEVDKKEVAEMVSKYNLMAVPVVDEDDQMLGIITVDDIVDILLPTPLRRRR